MFSDLVDLDHSAVLQAAEANERELREREVLKLEMVLLWADFHSDKPTGPVTPGGDSFLMFGGEGTPECQELCWGEYAVASHTGVVATKNMAADALDLRHRLPQVWALTQDLLIDAWVARKVASMSRKLSLDAVGIVDAAVAAAAGQSAGRIIAIAEAKVIEADLEAHRAKLRRDAENVGITVRQPKPGATVDELTQEAGNRKVFMNLPIGTAVGFGEVVEDVVQAIHDQLPAEERETITKGQLQVCAIELLSNPAAAAALLTPVVEEGEERARHETPAPKKKPATIYVHLTDTVLAGQVDGIARVEGIGPLLLEQLADLVMNRDITLAPVIDLNGVHAVNGYEHPTQVKHRTLLRTLGDVFPHSANTGYRRLDHDHCSPYDPGGPPGQTSDHNDAPLTRQHHRIKTHKNGWTLRQMALGAYRWTTPHGLGRLVTPTGTREFTPIGSIGELYWTQAFSTAGPALVPDEPETG